jgi:hypothetical protein
MTKPKSNACVAVSENGPYIVTGDAPLAKQTIGADAEGGSETWKRVRASPTRDLRAMPVGSFEEEAILRRNTREGPF